MEFLIQLGNTYLINEAMAIASSKHHEECGATTKKPRVCGLFDCVAHHRVNETQGPYLSISAMDRGDDYDKVGLIIAYIVYDPNKSEMDSQGRKYKNGDIIKPGDPMPCESVLEHCYPIIREYDGWKSSPIGSGKRKPNDPLPKQVQEFLAGIVQYTGAHIISIGIGPRSDDLIYLNQN